MLSTRARHLSTFRLRLSDGARTTLYVATYDALEFEVEVVQLARPLPLQAWCRSVGVGEALVGGFFLRPDGGPLGELWTQGAARLHAVGRPVGRRPRVRARRFRDRSARPAGRAARRARGRPAAGRAAAARRRQAGASRRPGGFSAGRAQFDSDITQGRYPRAALALWEGRIVAVACDGRARGDAGLTLSELAEALAGLGATDAINLGGGGSTSLVCGGRLRNRPRAEHGIVIPGGRPVSTALVLRRRV